MDDEQVTVTLAEGTQGAPAITARPLITVVAHPVRAYVGARWWLDDLPLDLGRGRGLQPGLLDQPFLSRRHLGLRRSQAGVAVIDLDSRNGSHINGERLVAGTTRQLESGDVIGLGPVLLLYHIAMQRPAVIHETSVIAHSAQMTGVLTQLGLVAGRDTTVLLTGETGVGKEVVARELHALSGRTGPFVTVNCGAVSVGVLQSELFGHEKGAFSGAQRAHRGLVGAAQDGTLFLDEIGDAPPQVQVALLRLLQEREYRPVGSTRSVPTNARFCAATHRNLDAMVAAGSFRQDLQARLTRWPIHIAPLRDRQDDIPHLAQAMADRLAGREIELHPDLVLNLVRHRWSGNVRELDAVMERLVVGQADSSKLRFDPLILPERKPPVVSGSCDATVVEATAATPASATVETSGRDAPRPRFRGTRPDRDALIALLRETGVNVRQTTERLGVGRSTLYRWLDELGIDIQAVRRGD